MSRILISLCLAVQFLQLISAQAVLPVVVVTTHGKVKSKLESGKCIKPVAGTLLKKKERLNLRKIQMHSFMPTIDSSPFPIKGSIH
ncbi:MAG: hypothetical protein IPL25_06895 [Saprospiraceae bacterium]|nr:hypothetical protein [Candidatus Vicinibacter affinis]